MKHIKKLYALLAVVILTAATVVWAMPDNQYFINNHTNKNLGLVTIQFSNAPQQQINVSGTGNYVVNSPGIATQIIINGTTIPVLGSGTAYSVTGQPVQVHSGVTVTWDIEEGN